MVSDPLRKNGFIGCRLIQLIGPYYSTTVLYLLELELEFVDFFLLGPQLVFHPFLGIVGVMKGHGMLSDGQCGLGKEPTPFLRIRSRRWLGRYSSSCRLEATTKAKSDTLKQYRCYQVVEALSGPLRKGLLIGVLSISGLSDWHPTQTSAICFIFSVRLFSLRWCKMVKLRLKLLPNSFEKITVYWEYHQAWFLHHFHLQI